MKLENQVVSLELSKKLKELGVKQDSLFYWVGMSIRKGKDVKVGFALWSKKELDKLIKELGQTQEAIISAFTVAELGEMLPEEVTSNSKRLSYPHRFFNFKSLPFKMPNIEADARAKMLIYLIENKLI